MALHCNRSKFAYLKIFIILFLYFLICCGCDNIGKVTGIFSNELSTINESDAHDPFYNQYIANCFDLSHFSANMTAQNKCLENYSAFKGYDSVILTSIKNDTGKMVIFYLKEGPKEKTPYEFLLPTIIGGALALLGSIITSFWNERSERKKSKFEWAKFLIDKYENNYLDFKKTISGTTSAMRIKDSYDILIETSFVPRSLQVSIEDAIEQLKAEGISDEEKTGIRNRLLDEFEKFILNPWRLL
jgi:hypothetical protein